jgi:hypothetical protein
MVYLIFYILLGIGLILLGPLILSEKKFLIPMINGTISVAALISFSLLVNKDWHGFKMDKHINPLIIRSFIFGVGIVALIISHFY